MAASKLPSCRRPFCGGAAASLDRTAPAARAGSAALADLGASGWFIGLAVFFVLTPMVFFLSGMLAKRAQARRAISVYIRPWSTDATYPRNEWTPPATAYGRDSAPTP